MASSSPGTVEDEETIARMVMSIHFGKNGIKPSLFSYVFDKGCSIQRDSIATDYELATALSVMLDGGRLAWLGAVTAITSDVRSIELPDRRTRALCVYDTAEVGNPAHGEICCATSELREGDRQAISRRLMEVFTATPVTANTYRLGRVAQLL